MSTTSLKLYEKISDIIVSLKNNTKNAYEQLFILNINLSLNYDNLFNLALINKHFLQCFINNYKIKQLLMYCIFGSNHCYKKNKDGIYDIYYHTFYTKLNNIFTIYNNNKLQLFDRCRFSNNFNNNFTYRKNL